MQILIVILSVQDFDFPDLSLYFPGRTARERNFYTDVVIVFKPDDM